MNDRIKELQQGHLKAIQNTSFESLDPMVKVILQAFKSGNKLLLCGNGGSAADAQHIAAEFTGRFEIERRGLPAIALTTDTSALTAIANDYEYANIFSRQIEAIGKDGDVLIAISTSGNSPNILQAVEKAKEMGIKVLGFSGKDGGTLAITSDECLVVGSQKTSHIQEVHIFALHAIAEIAENILFQ